MKILRNKFSAAFYLWHALFFLIFSCSPSSPKEGKSGGSAISGHIQIAVDKTAQPIVEALEPVFEHTYPDATLDVEYTSELEAMRLLSRDSVRMVVLGRPLNDAENAFFTEQEITVREQFIGSDAIVLAVHPSNPVQQLTAEQALSIIRGKVKRWNELSPSGKNEPINLVFDNANSGSVSYLTTKAGVRQLPANAFATNSYDEVTDYVATHSSSLGILGWSWLSDADDPQASALLSRIGLIALSPEDTLQGQTYFKPYQFDLQNDLYPFKRPVYFIRREGGAGLATYFTVFTTSEIGQRILLKSGVLPSIIPAREIEINTRPLNIEK